MFNIFFTYGRLFTRLVCSTCSLLMSCLRLAFMACFFLLLKTPDMCKDLVGCFQYLVISTYPKDRVMRGQGLAMKTSPPNTNPTEELQHTVLKKLSWCLSTPESTNNGHQNWTLEQWKNVRKYYEKKAVWCSPSPGIHVALTRIIFLNIVTTQAQPVVSMLFPDISALSVMRTSCELKSSLGLDPIEPLWDVIHGAPPHDIPQIPQHTCRWSSRLKLFSEPTP